MSEEFYYTETEFKKLSAEHFDLMVMEKLSGEEGLEIWEQLVVDLEMLKPCDGCVPPEFVDGEIEKTIKNKFSLVVQRAVWLAEQKQPELDLRVVIEPSYEGDTVVVVYDTIRSWVLLDYGNEAWNFKFETLQEVVDTVVGWSEDILLAYTNHRLKTKPSDQPNLG